MDIDEEESQKDFSRERNKVKNQRHNYTIKEIKIVLTKYKENKSVSETKKFFNIPITTVSGLVQKQDLYFSKENNLSSFKLKPVGRYLDSFEYDNLLLEFIKEGREHDIAITSSEIISKAMEIIPNFNDKSYDSLHHWFKCFREKYSYSIRKVTKISQQLPKNHLEKLREYLYDSIKLTIKYNINNNPHLLANVD